jgi:hypothetical protein
MKLACEPGMAVIAGSSTSRGRPGRRTVPAAVVGGGVGATVMVPFPVRAMRFARVFV